MHSSWLNAFVLLLLPLQTLAEVYDVSTTAALREALDSAAAAGGDNTIRLAAGTYSTQDVGKDPFFFNIIKAGKLTIEDSDRQQVITALGVYGVEVTVEQIGSLAQSGGQKTGESSHISLASELVDMKLA